MDMKTLCTIILERTLKEADKYQVGLTKIFFRAGMLALLESLRTQRLNQLVTLVQKNVRRRAALKQYRALRASTVKVQSLWRGRMARRRVDGIRRDHAATQIQTVARGYLERRKYLALREAVILVQSSEYSAIFSLRC